MEGCVHSLIHHYPPFFPCTIYGNTADTFWEIPSHILRNIIAWWSSQCHMMIILMDGCNPSTSLIHHNPPFFSCTIYGNTADTFWEIWSHILRNIIPWWSSQCHMMIILMDGCNPSTSLIHHNPPFFSCTIHGNTADTFWEIQSHILRNIITYMYWSSKYHAMIIPMRWMDVSPPPP